MPLRPLLARSTPATARGAESWCSAFNGFEDGSTTFSIEG